MKPKEESTVPAFINSDIFTAFTKQYNLTQDEQIAAKYLLALTTAQRAAILEHVKALATILEKEQQTAEEEALEKIEKQVEDFRQKLLDRLKKEKALGATETSSTSIGKDDFPAVIRF